MKSLYDIGLTDVKNVLFQKSYKVFLDEGVPNIIGIRSSNKETNLYDDKCWVFWNQKGKEIVHNYTITTHPGFYYLQHPIAGTKGTAILVPGQYLNCWTLGMHRGKQFALCQRAGEVSVYRDNNKNTILDLDPATITKGYFGIDIHHGSVTDVDVVDKYSAACQVFRYHEPHEELMQIFKQLSEYYKYTTFSYTLLLQSDFI